MAARRILMGAIALFIGLYGLSVASSEAGGVQVVEITDMQAEASMSDETGLPILLMFAAEHCHYCTIVEEDYLKPMIISGDYEQKVLIRKVDLKEEGNVIDFDGNSIEKKELASRYDINLTPTLLFLDGKGRQLTKRMVGLTTPDYYGGYIDMAIDAARESLQQNASADPAASQR